MADKQPIQKRGRGRPPKDKQNAKLPKQPIQPTQNSLNSIITNQPDDIESLVKHIDEKELAMAIDESYASNLSMQINAASVIENDFDNLNSSFEHIALDKDKDELSVILAEIQDREEQERKEQERLDAEFARQLTEEYSDTRPEITNQNNVNYFEEEQNESFIENWANGAPAPVSKPTLAYNIRAQQDYEYEESLLKDIAKEEKKIKSQMNIKNAVDEESENEDDNSNLVPEELPLTVNEIRKARLAFFNNK